MTSQDTQTNWNGITGEISVRIYEDVYIDNIRTFPDIHNKSVKVKLRINGADGINIAVFAFMEDDIHEKQHFELCADEYGYSRIYLQNGRRYKAVERIYSVYLYLGYRTRKRRIHTDLLRHEGIQYGGEWNLRTTKSPSFSEVSTMEWFFL